MHELDVGGEFQLGLVRLGRPRWHESSDGLGGPARLLVAGHPSRLGRKYHQPCETHLFEYRTVDDARRSASPPGISPVLAPPPAAELLNRNLRQFVSVRTYLEARHRALSVDGCCRPSKGGHCVPS